jgi:hypothetical protein
MRQSVRPIDADQGSSQGVTCHRRIGERTSPVGPKAAIPECLLSRGGTAGRPALGSNLRRSTSRASDSSRFTWRWTRPRVFPWRVSCVSSAGARRRRRRLSCAMAVCPRHLLFRDAMVSRNALTFDDDLFRVAVIEDHGAVGEMRRRKSFVRQAMSRRNNKSVIFPHDKPAAVSDTHDGGRFLTNLNPRGGAQKSHAQRRRQGEPIETVLRRCRLVLTGAHQCRCFVSSNISNRA